MNAFSQSINQSTDQLPTNSQSINQSNDPTSDRSINQSNSRDLINWSIDRSSEFNLRYSDEMKSSSPESNKDPIPVNNPCTMAQKTLGISSSASSIPPHSIIIVFHSSSKIVFCVRLALESFCSMRIHCCKYSKYNSSNFFINSSSTLMSASMTSWCWMVKPISR